VAWTCPQCQRRFGRRNQSHTCAPALSEAEYFASGAAFERPIYEAVVAHLDGLGPLGVDFVSVGILFKRTRTFAELRPMRNRVRLSMRLSRRVQDPRIVKTWRGPGERSAIFIDLHDPSEVDEQVRDWLTEAYLSSPE
jgi:hypothetical protein